jgi:hypothetical protein
MTRDLVIEVDEGKPSWVSTSGRRQIIELITSALKEASITDKVGLRFSTEANVRSRVMPPMTLALNVGRSGVPNSACVVAAAEDARNDLCAVLITGSQMQMDNMETLLKMSIAVRKAIGSPENVGTFQAKHL